jgi:hypothetical protein
MAAHHDHKSDTPALTMLELFAAATMIILFWLGLKFGMGMMPKHFPDYQNESWFGFVVLITGIVSGFILAGVFMGSCLGIGLYLKKRKKRSG